MSQLYNVYYKIKDPGIKNGLPNITDYCQCIEGHECIEEHKVHMLTDSSRETRIV